MIVGLPKEIKNNEHRVGLTPDSVSEISANGHEVFVETNCGKEIGFTNEKYSDRKVPSDFVVQFILISHVLQTLFTLDTYYMHSMMHAIYIVRMLFA